jgi:formate dehydrogenase (coenzyme F420) beta subunit
MQVNRILEVESGNTLQAVRNFLVAWWDQFQPLALLAPVEDRLTGNILTQLIEDPADLQRVNPFAPLMLGNAARKAYQLRQDHPGQRLGAILRPCELRTYVEMCKRGANGEQVSSQHDAGTRQDQMVIFGVDCMGTYSAKDYQRELKNQTVDELTRKTLRYVSAAGFQMEKYRTACQICDWPAPWGADAVIGTIGVDIDKYVLILAHDETCDHCLGLDVLVDHPATEYQVSHRETLVGAVAEAHAGMRKHLVTKTPGNCRFDDLGCLLAWFATCSLCGKCLYACPLYHGELDSWIGSNHTPTAERATLSELIQASRWLASCSGCGMCEEECHREVPLTVFISALSQRIREETHYIAGNPLHGLPWANQ